MTGPFYLGASQGGLSFTLQALFLASRSCAKMVAVWMSAFSALGGILSGPTLLPDLRDLMALFFSLSDQYPCFCCQPLLLFPPQDYLACLLPGITQAVPLFFSCFFWQLGNQHEFVPQFQLEFFCFPPLFLSQAVYVDFVRCSSGPVNVGF
ncbi:unnamed protein product [Acanthosepion pharaonis]|uniref:Uncharacterized protein n=1 Tax=Acanthosepion pharaonis TaxID=158019 RepID=A0A812DTT2_ACAPH|nr:unnamed protein product [Sepia pharaonis]